jgi:hypothetical protein
MGIISPKVSLVESIINLNADFRDDGQIFVQIRVRIEIVLLLLERIESQRRLFHVLRDRYLSWIALEKLLDLMNRAEYHLQEIERIQTNNSCQE